MTEQQWLSSTDPAAMYEHCRDRVTPEQMRNFVEACCGACGMAFNRQHVAGLQSIMNSWISDPSPITREVRADILRDIVPCKPIKLEMIDRCEYGPGTPLRMWQECPWLTWRDGTIPAMVDLILNEECECFESRIAFAKHKHGVKPINCERCNNSLIVPRAEPQWALLPALADMLEEAGCREAAILEHLRSERDGVRCEACAATGFHVWEPTGETEPCIHCNGTGRRKVRHWSGCYVLELLKGER